jgi:hypothetical protein
MSDMRASGGRIAFAQGGRGEVRLVLLTPPTEFEKVGDRMEARWKAVMPLRFDHAPILIQHDGKSDVPRLRDHIASANCPTWARKFGSSFRSRKKPLEPGIAQELFEAWERARERGGDAAVAKIYFGTMPHKPPSPDLDRKAKYEELRRKALGESPKSPCPGGPGSPKGPCGEGAGGAKKPPGRSRC